MRDLDLWSGRFSRPTRPPTRAGRWPSVAVLVEPDPLPPPRVRYRWDAETEILIASIDDRREGGWPATAVALASAAGAWMTLDLRGGRFCGLEVAVWPPVALRAVLPVPRAAANGHARCPAAAFGGDIEVDAELRAERDAGGRTVRLGVGPARPARPVRVARDMLLDVDDAGALAGVWLLHVPPLLPPA